MDETTEALRLVDAIRLERHRRHLKQIDVADMAGVPQPRVSDAENGRATLDTLHSIAEVLGIPVGQSA